MVTMDHAEIKQIRKSVGWTQQRLADAFGVNVRSVKRWESGENTPTGPAIKLLERLRDEYL